ncbi:glycosyltransferase [Cellulomonas sp. H30R-01]|uniref:glycosyltransferase n=1 Tax=Cellulomonas sp. H30R-01 TaxID=2704467 RepID=UPI00138D326D|nr:glycosyltransferase [Cellulomonas sp. H30R-01]QHT56312.1 glycosyltransferase [Cellulomonas sp. H30R-01]
MTETLPPVDAPTTTAPLPVTTPVTAVVVTRGRTRYLDDALAALAASTRRPARVLLVDVAPALEVGDALDDAFARQASSPRPQLRTVHVPGARTFGHAVRAALLDPQVRADGPASTWLWLLHDDSAPAPDALAELVRAVGHARSVAVAGVKQRTWTDPERLLEVGLRTSPAGRRLTDVAPGELDQGQLDAREDVLGVGLVGALVRRDVWDELDGPDPALGPFGDGEDLSRRARLAGHRVVVVPAAVVRHAQATYLGLRAEDGEPVDRDGDGLDDAGDPHRSYAARRRAAVHRHLAAVPLPWLPCAALLFLAAGLLRSLVRLGAKQPGLAVDELRAPVAALLRPDAVARARARARQTRRLPRRTLRPLQARWRDVWALDRDRRLARAEARRVVRAPSELELRELAALASRRRVTLVVLVVALALVTAVALGPLVSAAAGGASVVGGALVAAGTDLGGLWRSATSGWVAGGLGAPGPADPLLTLLLVPSTVAAGHTAAAVAALLLGGVLLSGLGAWAAAGAATRSVGARAWAAVVWAAAPMLLLAVGDGRLGPVLAHAALPWVALGLVRAVGVHRVDQVLSGLATARRADDEDETDPADVDTPVRGVPAVPTVPTQRVSPTTSAAVDARTDDAPRTPGLVGAPDPTGSLTAAAAAALAFAVVVAASPSLLVPGTLAVLLVALAAPRRRARLLLVPVPAVVVAGPLLVTALARGLSGWRLVLAEPGLPLASTASDPVARLLGVPADASALVPGALGGTVADVWPYLPGGVLVLLAALALLRGRPVARGVRVGWLVAALGLAGATVGTAVAVGVDGSTAVRGWGGPGLSLAWAGLLAAALLGADRLRDRLAAASFGWRQPLAALLATVAVLAPVAVLGGWTWQARDGDAVALRAQERAVVPAVGQQAQTSPLASRVLAVEVRGTGDDEPLATWQLMRADGPQLDDVAAATSTRALTGDLDAPRVRGADAATQEVDALVARLVAASGGDVAGELAALAVADVLVPALPDAARSDRAERALRDDLVSRLDSTPGLERVTQTPAGTLWRVRATADAGQVAPVVVPSWARLVPAGSDVRDVTVDALAVAAHDRAVDAPVPAGAADRVLVLAERADPRWRAWLDGTPLRAVDSGWRQGFEVPADGGRLVVRYDAPDRAPWLAAQGAVLVVTLLLALPVRRRRVTA